MENIELSLEQYLIKVDFLMESALAAGLSDRGNKEHLWSTIAEENRRVFYSRQRRDFDYRFVLMPRVLKIPTCCGAFHFLEGFKVEGEEERKLETAGRTHRSALTRMLKAVWPFHKGMAGPYAG